MKKLSYYQEPRLAFRFDQQMQDPRDGLSLFGPLDRAKPEGIRWAVIGPSDAVGRMKRWVEKIQGQIVSGNDLVARPIFPGFEAAFNTKLSTDPVHEEIVDEQRLYKHACNEDPHQRVYRSVSMYADRIINRTRTEDVVPDVWCVVIPEYIFQRERPRSQVPLEERIAPDIRLNPSKEREASGSYLFPQYNEMAKEYEYEVHFHNQLKARLLKSQIPTQIIRETTIAHNDFLDARGNPTRPLGNLESAIAWNIATALFYKSGGRPWKLGAAREGVCYIGLVFKQVNESKRKGTACCAAQMFLDSGDGVVFKGAVGPWVSEKPGDFHLDKQSAKQIVEMCVQAYSERKGGIPEELFIHGRTRYSDEEWDGFVEGAGSRTKIIGIRLREAKELKLFRNGDFPVLRGVAFPTGEKSGYLWTRGMSARLRTYPGREVPNPINVEICRGDADIKTVMEDILALTKLNYNSCSFGDGMPVTLKFANAVGEILTAGPTRELNVPPLPFKYYI